MSQNIRWNILWSVHMIYAISTTNNPPVHNLVPLTTRQVSPAAGYFAMKTLFDR